MKTVNHLSTFYTYIGLQVIVCASTTFTPWSILFTSCCTENSIQLVYSTPSLSTPAIPAILSPLVLNAKSLLLDWRRLVVSRNGRRSHTCWTVGDETVRDGATSTLNSQFLSRAAAVSNCIFCASIFVYTYIRKSGADALLSSSLQCRLMFQPVYYNNAIELFSQKSD